MNEPESIFRILVRFVKTATRRVWWFVTRKDIALMNENYQRRIAALQKIIDGFPEERKYFLSELTRRDEIISRLKEDAERLLEIWKIAVFEYENNSGYATDYILKCRYCDHQIPDPQSPETFYDNHAPDCPVILHRALMKELRQ